MESESPAGGRIYIFDDLYTSALRFTLIQRNSPNSSFELRGVKFMLLIILICIINIILILICVLNLFERGNFSALSAYGATLSGFLIIYIRSIGLQVNREVVKRLLTRLEKLFPVSPEDQFIYNLPKHLDPIIKRNKIVSVLLSCSYFAFILMPPLKSAFFCLAKGQKFAFIYPFMDWFPIDDSQLVYYAAIYCLQTAWGAAGVLTFFYEDLVFSNSVTQMCMCYQFISHSLSQLDAKSEAKCCRKLRQLIQLQNDLILIRDDVNTIFSLSTFYAFIVIKVSICMFMYSLVNGLDMMKFFRNSISILILIIPVFQRCRLGTNLYEASFKLVYSIYDSDWYKGSPRYRKMLIIMMIRANIPTEIHASPLNSIGIDYFKELAVQTYELLMFLINFSN